jgi:hypothetical protein
MEEAIFVFDAEDATVVAKIDVGKGNGLTGIHITRVSSLRRMRARDLELCRKAASAPNHVA